MRSRPAFTGPLVAFAFLLSACVGDGVDPSIDAVGSDPEATASESGEGLRVTLTGVVSGETLCPGNTRPCATLAGDVSVAGESPPVDEPVRVTGTLSDGVLSVDTVEPVSDTLDWLADHCLDDGKRTESEFLAAESLSMEEMAELVGTDDEEVLGQIGNDPLGVYIHSIPEQYAIRWISPRQIVHLGVVGDAEPHRQALDELGIGDSVCVVGDFERSDGELARIQDEVVVALQNQEGVDMWGASRSPELGAVSVDLSHADKTLIADIEDQFGDGVILNAPIIVHNGTVADYEAAIEPASSGTVTGGGAENTDSIGLSASCGRVRFPTIPPDLDAFPPVDSEVEAVFDDLADHPVMVEMQFFLDSYDWFVADRTDDSITLFGRPAAPVTEELGPPYASMDLENRDGVWLPGGFGQCRIELDAPGYGSADTVLAPDHQPDPASTELHLWINENNCAGGKAPVDREVLPVVTETESSVEIVTLVEPVSGGADCPSNPWFPITVTLDEPLGDRTVYDGHESPRIELSWPPEGVEDLDG